VIGRDFDVALLTRLVEAGEDRVLDMLDEAVEASVVNESSGAVGRFTFAHALINHTLYEELGNTRRARLHRRIAEALEEICGDAPGARVGELAHHWIQATTPDEQAKAADYARQAGERALGELAPDEALRWFEQALELHEDEKSRDRCELLIGIGEAQKLSGEGDYRQTLLDASRLALELGDVDLLVRGCLSNQRGQASSHGEVDEERVELIEAAIEAAGDADVGRHARLVSLLAMELNWHPDNDRTHRLAHEAIELARREGDDWTLAIVLQQAALAVQMGPGAQRRHDELSRELLEVAERIGDPFMDFNAYLQLMITSGELGDFEAVDRALDVMGERCEKVGAPALRWTHLWARSARERVAGRLEEAQALAERAAEIIEPDTFMIYAAQMAGINYERGHSDESLDLMEAAAEDFPGISGFKPAVALARIHGGDLEGARADHEAWLDRGIDSITHDQAEHAGLIITAEVAFALRETRAMDELYERLSRSSGMCVWNGAIGYNAIEHYLGGVAALLGRHDDAIAHFESAREVQLRIPAPLWQARTLHWWGRTLLDRGGPGDAERARELLEEAVTLAEAHGGEGTAREARELAAAAVG
jgi:tetratricopeptide (TPR) repeat protein